MFVLGLYLVLALADVSVLFKLGQFSNGCLLEFRGFDCCYHLSLLLDNDWQFSRFNCENPTVVGKPSIMKMLLLNTSAEKISLGG